MKKIERVLISVGHPAQVHQFKYVYRELNKLNIRILFVAQDKEISLYLLDVYKLPFVSISKPRKGLIKKISNIPGNCVKFLGICKSFKPNLILSRGAIYTTWIAKLLKIPHLSFADTEHINIVDKITVPFITYKLTSLSYNKNLGKNHFKFSGNIELFYMHPNYFKPRKQPKGKGKKILLRFVAWDAYHDVGHHGLTLEFKLKLINTLIKYGEVLISCETVLPGQLEQFRITIKPEEMHSLMYNVDLFIGEGASMVSECACIGTPAIYVNPLSTGYIDELETYNLVFQYRNSVGVISKAIELLEMNNIKEEWLDRLNVFINNCIDPTALTVWFVENYPKSVEVLKKDPNYQMRFK